MEISLHSETNDDIYTDERHTTVAKMQQKFWETTALQKNLGFQKNVYFDLIALLTWK